MLEGEGSGRGKTRKARRQARRRIDGTWPSWCLCGAGDVAQGNGRAARGRDGDGAMAWVIECVTQ